MKKFLNVICCLVVPLFLFSQENSSSFNIMENTYVNMTCVSFDFDEQFTVMGWMKWDANSSTVDSWSSVMANNNNETGDYRQFWIQRSPDNSGLEFALQLENGIDNSWSDEEIKEGEWFHFAATFNGNQQRLFINGVEESGKMSTGSSRNFDPEFVLSLGSLAAWNFDHEFNGKVDRISVWKSVLSEEEINSLMISGIPQQYNDLVSYYCVSEVNNDVLSNKEEYRHITINDNIPNESIQNNESDYTQHNHKYGDYSIWQSDIAYQKAHQSDEVIVFFDANIYKLDAWYSFNKKPSKDSEFWKFVGTYDDLNTTIVSHVINNENQ